MYENILHQPLQIPVGRTVAACDLLQGLLHKDQRQRLGSKADFVGDLPEMPWLLPAEAAQKQSDRHPAVTFSARVLGLDCQLPRELELRAMWGGEGRTHGEGCF